MAFECDCRRVGRAQPPTQEGAPKGPPVLHPTNPICAEIDALEIRLSQRRGPSIPPLSLGKLQQVVNNPLLYAKQRQLVETLVIYLRADTSEYGYA